MAERIPGQDDQGSEGKKGITWKVRLAVSVARYQGTKLKDINLRHLSDLAHLSPASLSRRFRVEAECSIAELRAERQIAEALTFLETTDLEMKEIARNLGCSCQTLYRKLKTTTGCSGVEYREFYMTHHRSPPLPATKNGTSGQKMRHKSKF